MTSPSELHGFHNRLTHTLEVAQIARRISERFLREHSDLEPVLNPDVCETAALIHDLGHPPFGHNGEQTLDRLARAKDSSSDGYEGNAQSFRIVTKLAARVALEEGLDLTAATLRASLKYPNTRHRDTHRNYLEHSKFGIYDTELEEFDRVFPEAEKLPTLEASIMDWSDDIAYSVHDFYDFALVGLIPLSKLDGLNSEELRTLLSANQKLAGVSDSAFDSVASYFPTLPTPNLGTASRFSSRIVADLKAWVSERITRYATQELHIRGEQLSISAEIREEVEILKALTYHFAIGSPALALRQKGEQVVLSGLFDVLWEDIHAQQKLLSDEAKDRLESDGEIRILLDIVSGMTDAQALAMYHKAHGIVLASILDVTTPSML